MHILSVAVGYCQVLMTRFQRMTFYTLNRYFGLTKELLKVEDVRRDSRMSKARAVIVCAIAYVHR